MKTGAYKKFIEINLIVAFSLAIIIVGAMLINQNVRKTTQACFENYCFDVELAIKPNEQKRGLMFREQLDPDKGMLFIFKEEKEHSFWMKNTLIPLDIIWINSSKEVVFISGNILPCEEDPCPIIEPKKKSKYVLEINGNMARKINLVVGDKIDFDI